MDLWGSCTTCRRWFSMAGGTQTCPVCHADPAVVVDRDAQDDPTVTGVA